MSHARTQAGRGRVLGAALMGACVGWSGGPTEVAAAPAEQGSKRGSKRAESRLVVPLQVVSEQATDGPLAEVRVSAQRVDEAGSAIEVVVSGEGGSIELEPGVWSLIARAPGRVDRQRVLTLAAPGRGEATPAVRFVMVVRREAVVLQLGPPEAIAAGARWGLVHEVGQAREFAGPWPAAAREVVALEPGRWTGVASAPGFVTQEFTWTVGEPPPVIVLQRQEAAPVVAPPPPPPPRGPDPRLGLGLGLGLVRGGVAGARRRLAGPAPRGLRELRRRAEQRGFRGGPGRERGGGGPGRQRDRARGGRADGGSRSRPGRKPRARPGPRVLGRIGGWRRGGAVWGRVVCEGVARRTEGSVRRRQGSRDGRHAERTRPEVAAP
jgi:hypothetical protein